MDYSGYVDELLNQLNTAFISYASICVLQVDAFCILQKIFQINFPVRPAFEKVVCIIPRKGEVLPAFRQKGGDYMEPNLSLIHIWYEHD